jgi:hypothetical protein
MYFLSYAKKLLEVEAVSTAKNTEISDDTITL